jgi:hypothetical protein
VKTDFLLPTVQAHVILTTQRTLGGGVLQPDTRIVECDGKTMTILMIMILSH